MKNRICVLNMVRRETVYVDQNTYKESKSFDHVTEQLYNLLQAEEEHTTVLALVPSHATLSSAFECLDAFGFRQKINVFRVGNIIGV